MDTESKEDLEAEAIKFYKKHYKTWDEEPGIKAEPGAKNQRNLLFWCIAGEVNATYGVVWFYETKETLLGKIRNSHRPHHLSSVLSLGEKKEVAKKFPSKCDKCGFHRFFGIRVEETSIGHDIIIFCPCCKADLIDASIGDP
ncbi:Uncharacterised protein [Candidatus Gugararchaeum adminiculabundum]|nr:Uncharacterised protein [Candidatus Gugararchaeum adminiculabundum]